MDIPSALLWLYVTLVSVLFGGALFERLVLVTAWAAEPPRSVRQWNRDVAVAVDPGRFFRFVTLPLLVLTPLECYFAWSTPSAGRARLLASTVILLVVFTATFAYYLPTLTRLTMRQGEGLDDAGVVRTVRRWVLLQYARLLMVAAAWLCALSAFRGAL